MLRLQNFFYMIEQLLDVDFAVVQQTDRAARERGETGNAVCCSDRFTKGWVKNADGHIFPPEDEQHCQVEEIPLRSALPPFAKGGIEGGFASGRGPYSVSCVSINRRGHRM